MDENERTIDELIDLPYSEMTDEEIGRIIEWKAAIKARDAEHEQRMAMLHDKLEEIAAMHGQVADRADKLLESLTAHAIESYKAVSNGEA